MAISTSSGKPVVLIDIHGFSPSISPTLFGWLIAGWQKSFDEHFLTN